MSEYFVSPTGKQTRRCYHTDVDCRLLSNTRDPIPKDKAQIERMGLDICPACDPDYEVDRSGVDRSIYNAAVRAGRKND